MAQAATDDVLRPSAVRKAPQPGGVVVTRREMRATSEGQGTARTVHSEGDSSERTGALPE